MGLTLRMELELMLGDAAFKVVWGSLHKYRRHCRSFSPTAQVIVVTVDSHVRFNKCPTAHPATVLQQQWRVTERQSFGDCG